MKKSGLALLVPVVVILLFVIFWTFPSFDPRIGARIDRAVSFIEKATFLDLVPDHVVKEIVRYAAKQGYDSPNDSRHLVFDRWVCVPILRDTGEKCAHMLYAAYSTEGIDSWWWDERAREIPREKREIVANTRDLILEKAREFLRDRDWLSTFYGTKRSVMLEAVVQLDEPARYLLIKFAESFIEGLKLAQRDDIRHLAKNWLEAKSTLYGGEDDSLRKTSYGRMNDASREFSMAIGEDNYGGKRRGIFFALRRESETKDLSKTWIAIGEDFLSLVKTYYKDKPQS